jgi:hypothetical protein
MVGTSANSQAAKQRAFDLHPAFHLQGHEKRVCDVEWSSDGKLLASASRDRTIRVWNTDYANLRLELTGHVSEVRSLAWCHGGLLASGSQDHTVRIWDRAGREVAEFNHRAPIECVASSPCHTFVAAGARDGHVYVREVPEGEVVARLSHQARVCCVDWSRNGATLLSGSEDGDVCLWNTTTWECVDRLSFGAPVRSATFLVDDTLVAVAGKRARVAIFDVAEAIRVSELEGHSTVVQYACGSNDRTILATQSGMEGQTLIWDCLTWRQIGGLKTSRYRAPSTSFAFHPTRMMCAATARNRNQIIQIWSERDADLPEPPPDPPEFDVFLAHNGKDKPSVRQLADAMRERGIRIWLDEEQLVPGRPWQEALERIIQTTKTAAVLVGADGLGPWERRELRACLSQFVDRGLPVIPVLLPSAPRQPNLPLFLTEFTWVDFRAGFKRETLDRFEWGIRGSMP